ncbi:type II toxin-antitoxin system HicB family antitoxin [Streptomyces sp. NBC_01622]|uniref:Arc family DNA-binding protein n=1 Tax=Streptomyces sp. NBC_01622 TaxID=2975903 RepID=UPI0038688FA3|nr:type II toxin-antitoxin system HicB family antitoxin [Streptomyces sp. NBC_01622]
MDEETKITLRLPTELHRWLTAQAKSARRSLNSEIVYRLEGERDATVADAESPRHRS